MREIEQSYQPVQRLIKEEKMKVTKCDNYGIPSEYRENFDGLSVRQALQILRDIWWHDSRMDGAAVVLWLEDDNRIEAGRQSGIVRLDRDDRVVRRY